MSITDLFVKNAQTRPLTSKLEVGVARRWPAGADFISFVLAIVTVVLPVADPRLPDAVTARASEFSRWAMSWV